VRLEIYLAAVIERNRMGAWRQLMDGAPGAETLFIS